MSPRKTRLRDFLRRVWSEGEVAAVPEFIADTYTIHNDPGDPWHAARALGAEADYPSQYIRCSPDYWLKDRRS